MPPASVVLEPSSPNRGVGTVLGVARAVLVSDHPEAVTAAETEALGVVVHGDRVGRGRDRRSWAFVVTSVGYGRGWRLQA